jgi:phosphoglucosamine mutase
MFGTSGIRGEVGSEVTAELALSVGRALASAGYGRVVVGRDVRDSGVVFRDALSAGLRECGAEVVDVGTAATPTVARCVEWCDADAGVAVTASHNPPKDNGLKPLTESGQAFDGARRDRLTSHIEEGEYDLASADRMGTERRWEDAHDRHVAAIRDACDRVDGLHVAVDLGNGAGAVSPAALRDLGARVTTLNGQADGQFPGRPSEPTAETCADLCRFVAATDADLGIAHDGDADRMMAVDENGDFVPGDHLLALFARAAAEEGDVIPAPLNTSLVVDDALDAVGASVARTKVGDVFVAERIAETEAPFGGEPSGAWIWPAETRCPDGPLAACRLAEIVHEAGTLAGLLEEFDDYVTRRESRSYSDKEAVVREVHRRAATAYDDVDDLDGVRVETDDGWFLIRASGTQPLVRVTAEARTEERASELIDRAQVLLPANVEQ